MKAAGIICEYNPMHLGHSRHIEMTRSLIGGDCAVVCVMSGNFVQRGDLAVFNKHARAKTAILGGADLVVELPAPYSLLSAEGFAAAGVHILDSLGVCGYLSFGSESGDIGALSEAAAAIGSAGAGGYLKDWLGKGLSYAAAQQKAADAVLGERSDILKSPNNLLGIEYIKAVAASGSSMLPMTVKREGGAHGGSSGLSASALRGMLSRGEDPWQYIPGEAAAVYMEEIAAGSGPVFMEAAELAILSRLRAAGNLSLVQGVSEGLDRRLARYAASEPTVAAILSSVKTRRYTMSRIRRLLLCACLGISADDTKKPPPYIRVLAMNNTGMALLKTARSNARLPIITKAAHARSMPERAFGMFRLEAAATDFYMLACPDENRRSGGWEWRRTPAVIYNTPGSGLV